jgi:hypothetical protein
VAIAFRADLQRFLDEFIVKLPKRGWVKYTPRNRREAARLIPLLEVAARHVAEAA